MIRGVHAMFASPKAEEIRAFMRDKLEMDFIDAGEGWLLFRPAEGEVGAHPADRSSHEISFYCDDIEATVEKLKGNGVEFTTEVEDAGWGMITRFKLPDDSEVDLYQPKYNK